jgi:predicted P-loop ATPase/GTPase
MAAKDYFEYETGIMLIDESNYSLVVALFNQNEINYVVEIGPRSVFIFEDREHYRQAWDTLEDADIAFVWTAVSSKAYKQVYKQAKQEILAHS